MVIENVVTLHRPHRIHTDGISEWMHVNHVYMIHVAELYVSLDCAMRGGQMLVHWRVQRSRKDKGSWAGEVDICLGLLATILLSTTDSSITRLRLKSHTCTRPSNPSCNCCGCHMSPGPLMCSMHPDEIMTQVMAHELRGPWIVVYQGCCDDTAQDMSVTHVATDARQ